jgi:erythromycin esterase
MTSGTDPVGRLALERPGDLDPLVERIGGARVVCIGEATHGTHEFYRWRALLTRRLIEQGSVDLVAVEGDWPDCYAVSRSVTAVRGAPEDLEEVLRGFERWPTWMWANSDVLQFARWLRGRNLACDEGRRVSFYGLDVYSLWESLDAVLDYLREHHPGDVDTAVEACRCLEPYAEDPQAYARASRLVPTGCEREVVALLAGLVQRHATAAASEEAGAEAAFAAEQNARAAVGAEAYYRAMVRGGPDSWNVRDRHMADTLDRLLEHHGRRLGRPARAVVWEHNTHIGDARYTDMHEVGMVNVGQLVRERYGEEDCVLVGMGSHRGTVVAAPEWGSPPEPMAVPPARSGSVEALLNEALSGRSALLLFDRDAPAWAAEERDHRAIGVVYRPYAEKWGNYVPTVLARRYDAFLWFDETRALQPLEDSEPAAGEPLTWPSGS